MMAGTAEVGTLRVRSAAGDTPAVRLAAGAWLGGAELHPAELPPSAVLIVRRMADPLPGKLPSSGPAPPDPAWERAARASLDNFCRRAARPAHGPVPPDAEAVLFADEAEMLACLALDLARGNAFGCWWWSQVLRRRGARDLPRLLAAEPTQVPALLHQLARSHRAAELCQHLSETEAATILETVARAYEAPELFPGSAGVSPAGGRAGHRAPEHVAASVKPQTFSTGSPQPTWHRRLRTIPDAARLAPAQRVLLAVSLALFEEPARARSTVFAVELREWWEAGAPLEWPAPSINEDAEPRQSPSGRMRSAEPSPPDPLSHPHSHPPGEGAPPPEEIREPGGRHSVAQGVNPGRGQGRGREASASEATTMPPAPEDRGEVREGLGARTVTDGDTDTARTEGSTVARSSAEAKPDAEQVQARPDETAADDEVQEIEAPPSLLFEDGVATEIAGIFYLINLMTSLDLPDCFEEDWRLASRVGAWGVLEAIARGLLGDASHLAADPVWRVLAVLDSREPDEPPGRGYAGADQFRPPASWPVPHEAILLQTELLPLRHTVVPLPHELVPLPRGVVHGPLGVAPLRHGVESQPRTLDSHQNGVGALQNEDDSQQSEVGLLLNEGAALRHEGQRQPHEVESQQLGLVHDGLARWTALALPYLRLRLAQGLGLDPARLEELPPLLLLRPGRVHVTSTHVDVVLDLASISMPVRVSGLDRDPGWLPAFGRVVQFHFH